MASSEDTRKIENLFNRALDLSDGVLEYVNLWGAYAYVLSKNGKYEMAESIFSQLKEEEDSQYFYFWKSRADVLKSDYKSAYLTLKESLAFQDSIITVKLRQSSVRAQRDYYEFQDSQKRIKLRNRSLMFTVILLSLVILVAALLIIFREKRKTFRARISEIIVTSDMLRQQLEKEKEHNHLEKIRFDSEIHDRDEILSRLKSEYVQIYKSQFKTLGELCELFLQSDNNYDAQKKIYDKVKEMIKDLTGDVDGQKRFENLLNNRMNDVMKHFREDFPNLCEDDYRFVCYLLAGFDSTTLSVIFRMPSQASVYVKKSRFKKRIMTSTAVYKDEYLSLF